MVLCGCFETVSGPSTSLLARSLGKAEQTPTSVLLSVCPTCCAPVRTSGPRLDPECLWTKRKSELHKFPAHVVKVLIKRYARALHSAFHNCGPS
jgi:hypothetical protein